MVRARKAPPKKGGRKLALWLTLGSLVASVGLVYFLRETVPMGARAPTGADRGAVTAAERFINHWTRFEYGEALLVSTGETRDRVLQAMEKELTLSEEEQGTAAALRAQAEAVRMELRVRSVEDVGEEKVLRVTAFAHDGDEVFERDQVFRLKNDGGWKVTHWDTGRHPADKQR